ncbi:hypothetical protein MMC26_003722 [Xylographa opegraphella]|nr:hypothetical protein [Xylographa opegraphella]
MPTVLVVGASRGLGSELAKQYAARDGTTVVATSRSSQASSDKDIVWISGIDVASKDAGAKLAVGCRPYAPIDIAIITAGYFGTESFDQPDWDAEVKMYTTSAIGPVFLVHHLVRSGAVAAGAKIILVSSESGSITLRHESEGGGNYGHHASKAASNMVGKLLSLDLKEKGVAVGMVHPGFMRTEMTKGVGFDKFYDDGGAVTPAKAAKSLIDFVDKFDMGMTGEYWAPRGSGDIGTAGPVLGKDLANSASPLKLPW